MKEVIEKEVEKAIDAVISDSKNTIYLQKKFSTLTDSTNFILTSDEWLEKTAIIIKLFEEVSKPYEYKIGVSFGKKTKVAYVRYVDLDDSSPFSNSQKGDVEKFLVKVFLPTSIEILNLSKKLYKEPYQPKIRNLYMSIIDGSRTSVPSKEEILKLF